MRRSFLVDTAHKALRDPDKNFVGYIMRNVNLTKLEREIITKSEIDGMDLENVCNTLENWRNKKTICSYYHCSKIKRIGMEKIGELINGMAFSAGVFTGSC
jgi:hypothetical protein